MRKQLKNPGFAIAIAWPQTYCKQAGAWYDTLTLWLGISENNYYKAGHAALVLVDTENEKCHYFDFGRYHSPFGHGRVRSAETDHDLKIKITPQITNNGKQLENFKDILLELQQNHACHGEGELFASYISINFQAAYKKALELQMLSPIPYGPFRYKGSNCSRFVNTAILAGKPDWINTFQLKYFVPLTPTPKNNVNSLRYKLIIPELKKGEPFSPTCKLNNELLKSTLQAPERNPLIPQNAQWLSGEGAGSWFVYEFQNNLLKVIRYSPDGTVECIGLYDNKLKDNFILTNDSKITYPSNCKQVSLIKDNMEYVFQRKIA